MSVFILLILKYNIKTWKIKTKNGTELKIYQLAFTMIVCVFGQDVIGKMINVNRTVLTGKKEKYPSCHARNYMCLR